MLISNHISNNNTNPTRRSFVSEHHVISSSKSSEHRILVVEPNYNFQKIQKDALKKIGYPFVDITSNGIDALKLSKNYYYSLILTEIDLPVISGYELCKHLKKISQNKNVTIVALTSYFKSLIEDRCYEVGMKGVITKPLIYPYFKKIIKDYISLNQIKD